MAKKKKSKAFGTTNLALTGAIIKEFVDRRINDKLKDGLPTEFPTAEELTAMKDKLDAYPEITEEMKKDGKTWGIKNGGWDDVCEDGCEVWISETPTAMSLALESLQQGSLYPLVKAGADEKMNDAVKALLGDEIFNELNANTKATLENKIAPTPEQELEKAKSDYYRRKEESALQREVQSRLDDSEDKREIAPLALQKAFESAGELWNKGERITDKKITKIATQAIEDAKAALAEKQALEAQQKASEAEEVDATEVETGEKDVEPKKEEKS